MLNVFTDKFVRINSTLMPMVAHGPFRRTIWHLRDSDENDCVTMIATKASNIDMQNLDQLKTYKKLQIG
jgi:hypothetical protein